MHISGKISEIKTAPTNGLFGALVSLKNALTESPHIKIQWTKIGKDIFDQELKDKLLLS